MRTFTIRPVLMAVVMAVLLTGCTSQHTPTVKASPSSPSIPSATPTSQAPQPTATAPAPTPAPTITVSTDSRDNLRYWAAFDSAGDLQKFVASLGVNALYATDAPVLEKYPYVGSFGPACLVAFSYDDQYRNDSLGSIPVIEVTVFNRYGLPNYRYVDKVKFSSVKDVLLTQKSHCQ